VEKIKELLSIPAIDCITCGYKNVCDKDAVGLFCRHQLQALADQGACFPADMGETVLVHPCQTCKHYSTGVDPIDGEYASCDVSDCSGLKRWWLKPEIIKAVTLKSMLGEEK